MPPVKFRLLSALLLALLLMVSACGDNDDSAELQVAESPEDADTQSEGTAPEPEPVEADPVRPQRIVSLSPMGTEVLFAIGAGEQVVAVDEFSYYPPEAPVTDLSGWSPNVEAVLSYEPDLVVISNDANNLVAGLDAVGVGIHLSPAPVNLEQGYVTILDLGIAVGRLDEALALVEDLQAEIDAGLDAGPGVPIRVYHELDNTFFSVSSNSFIGAVYAAMGAENIADEADADGYGYPQLTEEYIIEADPELIVITDQVGYTPEDVAARPGWGEVSAVRNGNIVMVVADTASRWGPRLPQFIDAVAEALQSVAVPVS